MEEYKNTVIKPQINLITLQFPHLFCSKPFKMFVLLKKKKKLLKSYRDLNDMRAFISQ